MTARDIGASRGTDYLQIADDLSAEDLEYWRRARDYVDEQVLPVIGGYWERAEFPWPLIRALADAKLVGDGIEGYGCPPMSPIAAGLVHMELSRGDGSLGTFLGVQAGLAMKAIYLLGSEEQKQRWLPPMRRCFAPAARRRGFTACQWQARPVEQTNEVVDAVDTEPAKWIQALGIADRESGLDRAHRARSWLFAALHEVLAGSNLQPTAQPLVLFCGLLTRAHGLHDGIVGSIAADNPFAAFPLLRSYAENAAATLYATDHPALLERICLGRREQQVKIGTMTAYAAPKFAGWKQIYSDLSNYTHPQRNSLVESLRVGDDFLQFSMTPTFHCDRDAITACAWTVEMARYNGQALVNLARKYGMLPSTGAGGS